MQKPHLINNGRKNPMQHGKLRTDRCPRIINWFFQFECKYISYIVYAGFNRRLFVKSSNRATWKYQHSGTGTPVARSYRKSKNKNKDGDTDPVQGNLLRDLLEWLEDFAENLVDEAVSASRDTPASTSRESDSEPPRKVASKSRKHIFYTHFAEDRNCEICQRTKITRAPCRRRIGGAVPRAENFGDLITADHKVLSEGCESRNHHRYAVMLQDLATQWIQSYQCKTKTSQETQKSLVKFLEPTRKPKVIYTDNSSEFGKSCEDVSWNYRTYALHPSETNGIAERAVRRIKEGTSAVLLLSGLDEKWWADSMECYCYLRNILLSEGKTPFERRFGEPFRGPVIPFGSYFCQ